MSITEYLALLENLAFQLKAAGVFWASAAKLGGWPAPVPVEAYLAPG